MSDRDQDSAVRSQAVLTVSIATWNNRELLTKCLSSIKSQIRKLRGEVFVIDNASTDGTAEMIRTRFPWVQLIVNSAPMGFSSNHNQVLRRAAGRYVLLLNDDTVVMPGALVEAVEFMEDDHEAGIVGCKLLRPDGRPERVSQRFPHPLDPIFPWLRDRIDWSIEAKMPRGGVEVDRVGGACLLVRRQALDQVGLLDERFDPVYGEDIDLCYRIKKAGWKVYRLTAARVIHYRGQTIQREVANHQFRLQQAKFLWYGKHRSRSALWINRGAVAVAAIALLIVCLPQILIPNRAPRARARINRAWARLRACLVLARGKLLSERDDGHK